MAAPTVIPRIDPDNRGTGFGSWLVIAFNNDHNTYDEVMLVLMAATGCTPDEAYIETWEIDHLGKSVVHQGDESECQGVAAVITSIGLRTEVLEG
jgi:hypothetical protein